MAKGTRFTENKMKTIAFEKKLWTLQCAVTLVLLLFLLVLVSNQPICNAKQLDENNNNERDSFAPLDAKRQEEEFGSLESSETLASQQQIDATQANPLVSHQAPTSFHGKLIRDLL